MQERIRGARNLVARLIQGRSPTIPEISTPVKPSLAELRSRFEQTKANLAYVTIHPIDPSLKERELIQERLRVVESEIVATIDDPFRAQFTSLYCQNGLDLTELFEAEDEGGWTKPVREACGRIASWLGDEPERVFYSPHRGTETPLPYTGQGLLSWMLTLAESDPKANQPFFSLFDKLNATRAEGIWCGKAMTELGLEQRDFEPGGSLIGKISVLVTDKQYSLPMKLLCEVSAKIPGGKDWIDQLINQEHQETAEARGEN